MGSLILTLLGCTHLGTLDDAIPLPPGAGVFTTEVQVTRAPNPVSTPTFVPLPAVAFHYRHGLGPDVDAGLHVYPLGLGLDVRHRFAQLDGWHFATQPGVAGFILPWTTFHLGHLDVSLPVRAEHALGPYWSIAGGPGVIGRQLFFGTTVDGQTSNAATFELYLGGGARVQRTGRRLRFGISADLYVDTLRTTGLYGGVGFDLGIQRRASVDTP